MQRFVARIAHSGRGFQAFSRQIAAMHNLTAMAAISLMAFFPDSGPMKIF
jgi:hypothetical protein